jgi:hypothetical protein
MTVRTTALDPEEKKELGRLLTKMKVMPKCGKIVLHVNEGNVTAIEPRPMLR